MISSSRLSLMLRLLITSSERNVLNEEMKRKFKGKGTRKRPQWWEASDLCWWLMTDSEQTMRIEEQDKLIKQQQQHTITEQASSGASTAAHAAVVATVKTNKIRPVPFMDLYFPENSWSLITDDGRFRCIS